MIYSQAQILLGTVLINGVSPNMRDALNTIGAEMLPDAFCRDIYKAVMALDSFNATVSLEAVAAQMGNVEFYQLGDFSKNLVYTREPMREANQIRSFHNDQIAVRDMGLAIEQITSGKVFDRNEISQLLQRVSESIIPDSIDKPVWFSEYEESYMQLLESREADPSGSILDIGLDVDVPKNALVILGGQPGQGKTALALYIIDQVASQNIPCLMFSLEMDGIQLFERQVSAKTGITSRELKRPSEIDDYKYGLMANALSELCKKPVAIDDNPKLSIEIFKKKCRDFKNDHPNLGLITVDYVTLMEMPNAQTRALSVGEVTRQMKVLAKELKTPILLLSQLNRESAKEKREPMNSDLRDSGSIEQDADIILFPYRDEVHNPESPNKGTAKVLRTKVRDGEPGVTLLRFEKGSFKPAPVNECGINLLSWSHPEQDKPVERKKF